MAGNRHLSEDEVKLIVDVESSKAQQEIHTLKKNIGELEKERGDLLKQQAALSKANLRESKEYKDLTAQIQEKTKSIKAQNTRLQEMQRSLGTSSMTMAQLRKEARHLKIQMDNTSASLEPQTYAELARRLGDVTSRMEELRREARGLTSEAPKGGFLSKLMGSATDFASLKSLLASNAITKGISMVADVASQVVVKLSDMVSEGIEMAKSADGIRHAFDQLDNPALLDNLRKDTHGTLTDIELMKAAVQAKDFRLPLDQLGKYLEFAQLKAQQTGQSVDFLTNSIVTGLGRKSKMILDNLGISASEIDDEMKKGGDMAVAVGRIIDRQLQAQGQHYEDAAEREKRAVAEVQNAQRELGDELLPLAEAGSGVWNTIQKAALEFFTYLVKAFKQAVTQFTDIYNSSLMVRTGIAAITTTVKTSWATLKLVGNVVLTAIKSIGKNLLNLGKMVEGVFTLDFKKVQDGFAGLVIGTWNTMKGQVNNFKNFGREIGENFTDGFNDAWNGKITAPSFERGTSAGAGSSTATGTTSFSSSGKDLSNKTAEQNSIKQLRTNRAAELAEEERLWQQQQNQLKRQLAEREITQEEYAARESQLKQLHLAVMLGIERDYSEQTQALTIKDATQKAQLVQTQHENEQRAQQQYNQEVIAAQQLFYEQTRQLADVALSDKDKEELAYQHQLNVLRAYYESSKQYAIDHGEDVQAIEDSYRKASEQLESQHQERLRQAEMQRLSSLGILTPAHQFAEELRQIDRMAADGEITADQARQARLTKEQEFEQKKAQIRQQYGLVPQQEMFNQEMLLLEQQHQQGLLSETEYEQAKSNMRREKWKSDFDQYSQLFGGAVSALQNAEIANVEAKYDAEIEAARKAGKDTTDLENKKANETLKIQKKYADVNFAIKASEIIANTTVAIMKALADLGPIAGPVAAALMGVTGAAQLAAANAEREKVKRMTLSGGSGSASGGARVAVGREEGGFVDVEREQDGRRFHARMNPKKRGYIDRPTVIVGEGPAGRSQEWVASNAALQNPTVKPLIDIIDRAQRIGQVSTLDMRKYLLQQQMKGLATGGGVATLNPDSQTTSTAMLDSGTSIIRRLTEVLERIDTNGVHAGVYLNEIDEQNQLLQRSRNIGAKKE